MINQQQYIYQNPQVINPNINPLVQNQIILNNQLQYQQQIALQNAQRNQQLQNIQKAQQAQKMHNYQQNQLINAQKNAQLQNAHNFQKHHQTHIPHQHQNIPVPQNIITQKQVVVGQNQKTYIQDQIPNKGINTQLGQNQKIYQKNNQPINQNQGQILKGPAKPQKQLAVSHLNIGQSPSLEPLPPNHNQQTHVQIQAQQQQPQQQKQKIPHPQTHHHQQNRPSNQPNNQPTNQLINQPINQPNKPVLQNQGKIEENLVNTIFQPAPQTVQPGQNQNQVEPKLRSAKKIDTKKSATFMTVNSLANIPYNEYPQAEYSTKPFYNISGYASNSYNGAIKSYNEDMVKVVKDKYINKNNNTEINISYFGVFDGHGGDKCSKFLKENMYNYILKSNFFTSNDTIDSIKEAFEKAEHDFSQIAIRNSKLEDKSGSCAVISLVANDVVYSINLGDSRALYSKDGGKEFIQITRDHKPNDEIERKRIEKNGGKVYYANKVVRNGVEITLKEENYGKGFTFPYRLLPSGLAVSIFYFIINIGCQNYR